MASTPADLLALAHELAQRSEESFQRSASSRAYYAAFHLCDGVVASLPVDASLSSHERVIRALADNMHHDKNRRLMLRSMGVRLSQVRDIRVVADYRVDENFTASQTQTAMNHVGKIFGTVEALPKDAAAS